MKVILFGATGMVGQGVLRECLEDQEVESVLVIGRASVNQQHPRLIEVIRQNMFDTDTSTLQLKGYTACFFCLGVSSAGMNEADYTRLTFDLTIGWANALKQINPSLTFVYVSGAGTGGKPMWAKVKKRTEDTLLRLFESAYMIRLAALRPMNNEVSKTRWTRIGYSVLGPLLPLLHTIAPGSVITTEELGKAMIELARHGTTKHVLDSNDLRKLARK